VLDDEECTQVAFLIDEEFTQVAFFIDKESPAYIIHYTPFLADGARRHYT